MGTEMSNISVEYLFDTYDCDTCGNSYAEGFKVSKDGKEWFELTPHAHCYDGDNFTKQDLLKEILERLGHTISYNG